jgi:predicted Ser/Thr protein kinase/tetratricopeptide (TPR) repeat protein
MMSRVADWTLLRPGSIYRPTELDVADDNQTQDMLPVSPSTPWPAGDTPSEAGRGTPLVDALGPYRILRLLGEGGMGVVYLAEQDRPRRRVALKVLKPGAATTGHLRRFEHEADVLGRLQHPNIAQVFAAGTAELGHGVQPYFAMEYIDGQPLTSYAQERRLGNRERLAIMVEVCRAVQHAHAKGVIHRDLKPGNILVDASGQPKVLDFGVARLTDVDIHATTLGTGVGQLVGTIPYMSPEQAAAEPDALDTRSDIYTLGVLCYELLTGRLPHTLHGKSPLEAARTIREDDPVALGSVNRAFRGDLETIIATALDKDPGRRYPSAAALADDIERYLTNQPIVARRAGALYRMRKFVQRNKAPVVAVVAVILALIGGSWLWAALVVEKVRADAAERDRARQDIEYELQAAELALQRGQWHKAADSFDRAIESGHGDAVGLVLKKARALLAAGALSDSRREIDALKARGDLGEREGTVLLLDGDTLLATDRRSALERINSARAIGLSRADDHYAQALLASTSPEAAEWLQRSLDEEANNPRAQSMLAGTLLLLGRFRECRARLSIAKARFPDDASPLYYLAMLEELDGNSAAAQEVLARMRNRCSEREVAQVREVLPGLAALRSAANLRADQFGEQAGKSSFLLLPRLLELWGAANVEASQPAAARQPPAPPIVQTAYGHVLAALNVSLKGGDEQEAIKELTEAVKIHPEGTLYYLLAITHFNIAAEGAKLAPESFVEAEKAATRAIEGPSLLPIRRGAIFLAATCQGLLGSTRQAKPDLEMRKNAVANIHALMGLGPIRPLEFEIATKIANMAGDVDLTRTLLAAWEPIEPTNASVVKIRYDVELKSKNFGRAVEASADGMRLFPKDPAWRERHTQALEGLRQQLKAVEALPVPK